MSPAARKATGKPQRGLLVLFLILLLVVPVAAAQTPRVLASTYRIDLGDLLPGDSREGVFSLSNPTLGPIRVYFSGEREGGYIVLPPYTDVAPGSSNEVRYHYRVPVDAAPGLHGEAVRLVAGPMTAVPGVGTLDAATAIIVTSRTRAVGVTAIEGPTLILPGEPVSGRVLIVNTDNVTAEAGVRLDWLDAAGRSVAQLRSPALSILPAGTGAFNYSFENVTAAPGVQSMRATVLMEPSALAHPSGHAIEHVFLSGIRSISTAILSIVDLRDGNATIQSEVVNTGTVPVTFSPRLTLKGDAGTFSVVLDATTLQPGERRVLVTLIALPPGRFTASLIDDDDQAIELSSIGTRADFFQMGAPEHTWDFARYLWPAAIIVTFFAALFGLFWAARRYGAPFAAAVRTRLFTLRTVAPLPATPIVATHSPPPSREESLHDFLARMEEDETPRSSPANLMHLEAPLAVFVDLVGLSAVADPSAILRVVSAGRRVREARAYVRATSEEEAARIYHDLDGQGFIPRVRAQADFRVEITLDALRAAREGLIIVLATHDLAFTELAIALRAGGARVELAGVGWRLPPSLREQTDAVHDLSAGRGRDDVAPQDRLSVGRTIRL